MAKIFKSSISFMLVVLMLFSSISIVFAEGTSESKALQSLVDKVNNGLDADDRTDVTLTVPGMADSLGMDIVYITGGKISKEAADSDIKIKNLKETIREVIKTGTPVNFGIVTYSHRLPVAMPLTTFATEEDLENFSQIIEDSYNSYGTVEGWSDGGGNMEQALTNAKALLSGPNSLKDYPERQHIILYSSGHTYEFNDGKNNEYSACAPSYTSGTMYYAGSSWCYLRNAGSSRYYIPQAIVDTYKANKDKYASDWDCYWSYITKWVEADRLDEASENPQKSHVYRYYKYGDPVDTSFHLTEDEMKKYPNIAYKTTLNKKDLETANAIIYERAMYEAYEYVKPNIIDAGINLHPIYNPINASRDVNGINGRNYVGHCFMNMLDKLAGGDGEAPIYKYVDDFYFESVKAQILYTSSIGSYVEDFIGANENGNFEFIKNEAFIKLNVGGVDYFTTETNTAKHIHDENCICGDKNENAMISYAFSETLGAEPTFWLDYYYGDGETTERFIWTFGENVSLERKAALTYKLQLTEKLEGIGGYDVPTNNSATFYPIDNNGNEGTPQDFPVPSVKYEVNPYDVDIVLALGAGMAQYDFDAKYNNTYSSIVSLVKPLIEKGINVKLGLVAVEHYDDVAMPLTVLTKENYETVITEGLNAIQKMPAGPTNLHSNIEAAQKMLEDDKAVPDANKFFYVFATGRTYNFDNEDGVPSTIINQVSLKGNTYYYWGHYLWQSQRGGHTSLYMIPAKYNNDFNAYWKDVCAWVEADGDKFVYSFTDAYDVTDPQWFNTFYNANNKDAKALKIASSRFGWILGDLTNSGHAAIGSGSNPENALNYERAQYEAYKTYVEMASKYNCYALCTESPAYLNESLYITLGAGYKGTSTIQLGHSFMDHLAKVDGQDSATVLFKYIFNDAGTPISTDFTTDNYFKGMEIDVSKLVKTEKSNDKLLMPPMMSTGPKKPVLEIIDQPTDVEGAFGETVATTVVAKGHGLEYQWYFRNDGDPNFYKSSIVTDTYETVMNSLRANREVYCVITDANGNVVVSDLAKLVPISSSSIEIVEQPIDAEAAFGETISTTVVANGEGLKYQWYFSNEGDPNFYASSITTNTYETVMNSLRANREVYCVITDVSGNKVTTDTVTLFAKCDSIEIVEQPIDAEAALGEMISATVVAKGEGLKYQWYFRNEGDSNFYASSIKSATYETEMTTARAGREIYCVITDVWGNKVTTNTVKLSRVTSAKLEIVEQPINVEAAMGETISTTVVAKGEGLKYRWYFRNAGDSVFYASSITSDTYETVMNKTRAGREIYCVITDAFGNKITSETVTLKNAD